jgi:hypothetical protein
MCYLVSACPPQRQQAGTESPKNNYENEINDFTISVFVIDYYDDE